MDGAINLGDCKQWGELSLNSHLESYLIWGRWDRSRGQGPFANPYVQSSTAGQIGSEPHIEIALPTWADLPGVVDWIVRDASIDSKQKYNLRSSPDRMFLGISSSTTNLQSNHRIPESKQGQTFD
jgi:hypothetical protein